ncbi:condensation domain-containing protein [Streptantibioticus ferralitis]|uniref:AMP-binding protein n=1 Tax=Streptantibioticus ferralitis TaxID=236510 RepID=A0ABT5Z1L8_9ACTN|nr:condensation domain-containing protein [Streptantibioticus ferralitis]MDF2257738.1 AMP-binding protein [Streptantibioticus ferralitis]
MRAGKVVRAAWAAATGQTGTPDDTRFLSAGGHSLAAARLVARLQEELGVELPLAVLLRDDPTLTELVELVETRASEGNARLVAAAGRVMANGQPGEARSAPAGPTLGRLWVWHQLHPESPAYNVVRVIEVADQIRPAALRAALADLVERHEALRCAVIQPTPGRLEVLVGAPVPVPLSVQVVRSPDPAALDSALRKVTEQALPMDQAPLWRAGMVYVPELSRSWLVLVLHHVISDLRATDVLLTELAAAYDARLAGSVPDLSDPAPSLLAHLEHEAAQVGSARWRADLAWWAGQLAGAEPPAPLPLCTPPDPPTYQGQADAVELSSAETAKVAATLLATQLTPAAFFLAASVAVLSAWTGGERPEVVGLPSVRRTRPSEERLVGFLLDTLPLRLATPAELAFTGLCEQIRTGYLEAAEHSLPPYNEVLRVLNLPRTGEASPLIRLWFNDLTTASCPEAFGGAPAVEYDLPPSAALFEVNLYLRLTSDGRYRLHLVTPAGAMERADATALLDQVRAAVLRAAADPAAPLHEVLATAPRPVEGAPPASTALPATTSELLRRWADRAPNSAALADSAGVLDYRALDAEVDRVADTLPAGARIAVPARRDRVFVTRLLACWRAEAVPVLVDAGWPQQRRAAALAAAGATSAFDWTGDGSAQPLPGAATEREPVGHVLFTSGSTGTPLAVAVPPGAAEYELDVLRERYTIGPGDRVSFLSGAAHDVALRDVVLPLRAGATVCIPPQEVSADAAAVPDWLAKNSVTVANATPLLLGLAFGLTPRRLDALRLVVCGGAPLSRTTAELVRTCAPAATLVNGYGCTETPQLVTAEEFTPGQPLPAGGIPVGTTISDRRVALRSDPADASEQPVGRPGEVWVAGPRIASGYLGTELSRRYTVDKAGVRWFRTGDLARRDAEGRLHLAGRTDRQVLVNGHRLALDEVELMARALPGVSDAVAAVVGMRTNGGDNVGESLRLWVRPGPATRLTGDDLRRALQQRLPAAAVPARVLVVDRLPTTTNLKAAVPDELPALPQDAAPDERLRLIAESIAGGPLDPTMTFFAAGFTSVSLLQLTAELAAAIGRPVPPVVPFRYPTLRALSNWLTGNVPVPARTTQDRPPAEVPSAPSVRHRLRQGSAQALRAARLAARARLSAPSDEEHG